MKSAGLSSPYRIDLLYVQSRLARLHSKRSARDFETETNTGPRLLLATETDFPAKALHDLLDHDQTDTQPTQFDGVEGFERHHLLLAGHAFTGIVDREWSFSPSADSVVLISSWPPSGIASMALAITL